MKKKFSYRDKLLELAFIYKVKEIQDYEKNKKTLTIGQLELILKKNKIIIPKDFQTNFLKENFLKPIAKFRTNVSDFKDEKIREKNRFLRKTNNFKYDTIKKINSTIKAIWLNIERGGINFFNILPTLGKTVYKFFADLLTNLFNGIYNQQINQQSARKLILGFFIIVGSSTLIVSGFNYYEKGISIDKITEIKKTEKKSIKKSEKVVKKDIVKQEKKVKKQSQKPELKVKEKKVTEVILPDLNLKTETVLNLFKDVDYDLSKVRDEKLVKPIYFTQFPKDLENLESVKLKKETFIKIVLPLVVAENEKILADKEKLKLTLAKKFTTDLEKQWLRQKLLEYKVKKGNFDELDIRMDIIPVSIALAQAAKESGWGTSRFALEGNAIFGQWTWDGQGIAPLNRDNNKNHKILKFPILRASVKAYQNNLNTHKSYSVFRNKRNKLRENNNNVVGLKLTDTLKNYAQTGSEYTKILNQIITQNNLSDFELVRLVNSVKQIELNS